MSRLSLVFVALGLLAAGCVTPTSELAPASTDPSTALGMPDVDALVHVAGDALSAKPATGILARLLDVGHNAAEPTIAITKDGVMFYAGITFDNDIAGQPTTNPRTDILRSQDGGLAWEDVTPWLPGGAIRQHPVTGDPMVHVDEDTGRVFDIDQINIVCYELSYSDDLGDSWAPPTSACLSPPADHQTIVTAKPRTLPTVGYQNLVFVCYNQIATTSCTRSIDGGRTFQPTGAVGALGIDPGQLPPEDPMNDLNYLCSALVGHLAASPDGIVYLPRGECRKPMLYITKDDGLTWTGVQVSERAALAPEGVGVVAMDPVVTVDMAGTVYYMWQADDGHLYLTTSNDQGLTWTPEIDILAPGLTGGSFPAIAAVAPGKVAIAYYGTTFPDPFVGTAEDRENATWDGYLGFVEGLDGEAAPTVTTVRVNPAEDPLVRGQCGPDRCPGIYDFMDVDVDATGRPWAAFVDACYDACALPEGTIEDNSAGGGKGLVATLDVVLS